jgi:hypothetical protein
MFTPRQSETDGHEIRYPTAYDKLDRLAGSIRVAVQAPAPAVGVVDSRILLPAKATQKDTEGHDTSAKAGST